MTVRWARPDTDAVPEERENTLCLNCGKVWLHHSGWACKYAGETHKSKLPENARYLTADMTSEGACVTTLDGAPVRGVGDALIDPSVPYGARCEACGDFNEFAVRVPGFKCYGCRTWGRR